MRIEDLTNFLKGSNQEKVIKTIKEDTPSFEDTLKESTAKESASNTLPFTKDNFMSDNSSLVEMFKFFDMVNALNQDPPTSNNTNNPSDPNPSSLLSLMSPADKSELKYSFDTLPKDLKNKIEESVDQASKTYNVPKELIYAIIDQESSFNPYSVNHNKDGTTDRGLMQVNYEHNLDLMKKFNITDKNQLFDPKTNIEIGTDILSRAFQEYGNWPTAIKAYNGINANNWDYVKSVISKINKFKNAT